MKYKIEFNPVFRKKHKSDIPDNFVQNWHQGVLKVSAKNKVASSKN